ncbi:MAG: TolC family protein [Verrucomicrobiales bacterium]
MPMTSTSAAWSGARRFDGALWHVAVAASFGGLASCVVLRSEDVDIGGRLEQRIGHSVNVTPASGRGGIPPRVNLSNGISQQEAVALALWNNAAFHETLTRLGFSRADVIQAGLLSNPTFSVLFPIGPKQLEYTAMLPVEAFWLRIKRKEIAGIEHRRVAESLVQNGLDLVRDVKVAYAEVLLTKDRSRLAREAANTRGRMAGLAEARLKAGDASELETSTSRVAALQSQEEANQTTHSVAVAEERLRNLLGLGAMRTRAVFNDTTFRAGAGGATSALVKEAFASRPDLRAAELAIEAAARRAGLAKADVFKVSATVDANAEGKSGHEIGPGLQLELPIFNQGQATRAKARAEIERTAWNYLAVKDRIRLEVQEAHLRLRQAQQNLSAWQEKILPPLEQNVAQAEKAFAAGETTALLVHETVRQLLAAKVREAEIRADARRAAAELERGIGHRL